jgi:hypothetical protein
MIPTMPPSRAFWTQWKRSFRSTIFRCMRHPAPAIENSIVAISSTDSSVADVPDAGTIAEVQQAFQEILTEMKGWKPS